MPRGQQGLILAGDIEGYAASFRRSLAASNLAPRTVQTYMEGLARFIAFLSSSGMPRDLAAMRQEHVESFIESLLTTGKPASAANRYRSLQAFFRWALEEGELKASPMTNMRPPKVPEAMPAVLTQEQVRKLLKTCSGQGFEDRRDTAIILTFYATGARLAEIANLRWTSEPDANDVELDAGLVTVLGKGRRVRRVTLGRSSIKALDRYIFGARRRHLHAESEWLWLGKQGRLTSSGIAQMLSKRGLAAGITDLHPHRFRHAYAHEMLASGMQESDLMVLAGWQSTEMLRRYARGTAVERAHAAARNRNPADRL